MMSSEHKILGLALAAIGFVAGACLAADPVAAEPDSAVVQEQLEVWWTDLEKPEPEASWALLNLAAKRKEVVPFLKEKMSPLKIDDDQVRALLAKLASDKEEVWKPVFEELEYFDPRLAINLQTLMKDVTKAPARQRMVELLSGRSMGSLEGRNVELRPRGGNNFNFFDGTGSWWAECQVSRLNNATWGTRKKKWTRAVRAIVLLEHIGTPDALNIVKNMATGHPEAQPTKIAKQVLAAGAGKAP
jgi:hypothetical protein